MVSNIIFICIIGKSSYIEFVFLTIRRWFNCLLNWLFWSFLNNSLFFLLWFFFFFLFIRFFITLFFCHYFLLNYYWFFGYYFWFYFFFFIRILFRIWFLNYCLSFNWDLFCWLLYCFCRGFFGLDSIFLKILKNFKDFLIKKIIFTLILLQNHLNLHHQILIF